MKITFGDIRLTVEFLGIWRGNPRPFNDRVIDNNKDAPDKISGALQWLFEILPRLKPWEFPPNFCKVPDSRCYDRSELQP